MKNLKVKMLAIVIIVLLSLTGCEQKYDNKETHNFYIGETMKGLGVVHSTIELKPGEIRPSTEETNAETAVYPG